MGASVVSSDVAVSVAVESKVVVIVDSVVEVVSLICFKLLFLYRRHSLFEFNSVRKTLQHLVFSPVQQGIPLPEMLEEMVISDLDTAE